MSGTNLRNLQPITTFTIDGWKYEKLEDGRIQRTNTDGTDGTVGTVEIGGSDIYYNAIHQQLQAIRFFRDHQNTFRAAVREKEAVCTDPQTLVRNFAHRGNPIPEAYGPVSPHYMIEVGRHRVWIYDRDDNGQFDSLVIGTLRPMTIPEGYKVDGESDDEQDVYAEISFEGSNDFDPLISALLMTGVAACEDA